MLTSIQRREIVATEYREALRNITPNMESFHSTTGERIRVYSGQQIAAAKGIARKRAMAIIDKA